MGAMATKGLLAMLDDAYRCRTCGGSNLEFAVDGRMRFSGRGEPVSRNVKYAAPSNPCTCKSDNAAGAGAATINADSISEADTPTPQPSSLSCPACHDTAKKPGLCASCDVYDAADDEVAPMTGRVNYGSVVDPFGTER